MKHFLLKAVAFAALGGAFGCDKAEAPATPLTCSFQLLNEQGREAAVFPQGQNIIFRLLLVNPTNQAVVLKNPPFSDAAFLAVTRLTPGEGAGFVGKPYQTIFCMYSGAFQVLPHDTVELSIPWVESPAFPAQGPFCLPALNAWLPAGRYRTAFPIAFTVLRGYQETVTAAQTFSKEFEVK